MAEPTEWVMVRRATLNVWRDDVDAMIAAGLLLPSFIESIGIELRALLAAPPSLPSSLPEIGLPREPSDDMATAGARVLGSTMHADNQHARAIQIYRAMAETARTGCVPDKPVNAAPSSSLGVEVVREWEDEREKARSGPWHSDPVFLIGDRMAAALTEQARELAAVNAVVDHHGECGTIANAVEMTLRCHMQFTHDEEERRKAAEGREKDAVLRGVKAGIDAALSLFASDEDAPKWCAHLFAKLDPRAIAGIQSDGIEMTDDELWERIGLNAHRSAKS